MGTQEPSQKQENIEPFVVLRSYRGFEKYLEDALRMRVVSYCTSPKMILELFEEHDLTELEVIVGEKTDFREEISSVEVARRLEQYKNEGALVIYLAPDRDIHTKFYLIEYSDDQVRVLNGSPNFTETAWAYNYQVNSVDVFDGQRESKFFEQALDAYREYKDICDPDPFLEDLTEELEARDEPDETIIEQWLTNTKPSDENELREFHGGITARLGDLGTDVSTDEVINESLKEYSDRTRDHVTDVFSEFDVIVGDASFNSTVGEYGRAVQNIYEIPKLWIADGAVHLLTPSGTYTRMTEPPPDRVTVNQALANIEAYLETVDTYAETDDAMAAKAHMYEALLYVFWAPFVNQYAKAFGAGRVNDVEKSLPFLYIHGEPNAGKGTFIEFALRLISDNTVVKPLDGADVGTRTPKHIREPVTAFPVAIDDLERSTFDRLGGLRNYWESWDGKPYPALIITSNENKPKDWFMHRAKMVQFKMMFSGFSKARLQTRRLIEEENSIYKWFTSFYLRQTLDISQLTDEENKRDDILGLVRRTLQDLYEYAGRDLPPYFPVRPAEWEYDIGRERWQDARERDQITLQRHGEQIIAVFDETINSYEIDSSYLRNLPKHIRARRVGNEIWLTSDEAFEHWLDVEITEESGGVLSRLRARF